MPKPTTKHERNAAKALARSKRNSPPTAAKTSPHKERRAERLAGAAGGLTRDSLEAMTVEQLRTKCLALGVHVTTKMRKGELVTKLVGR